MAAHLLCWTMLVSSHVHSIAVSHSMHVRGRFKSNFATLDTATGVVVSRRADRRFEELGPVLCDHLAGASPAAIKNSILMKLSNLTNNKVVSLGKVSF